MEFRVLGPVEVIEDGRRLAVASGRQLALLAFLLIHANRVVSVERIIDELWGDEPPESGAKTVAFHVSRLRDALEPGRPTGLAERGRGDRAGGYVLRVEPDRIDAVRFERLASQGRAVLSERPRDGPRAPRRGAGTVARRAVRRRRRRVLRPAGDPAAGRAPPAGAGGPAGGRPRAGPACRRDRRAPGARRAGTPARTPARPAHGRALPRRAAGRGAPDLRRGSPGAGGRARHRPGARAPAARGLDPAPGPATRGADATADGPQPVQGPAAVRRGGQPRLLRPRGARRPPGRAPRGRGPRRSASSSSSARAAAASRAPSGPAWSRPCGRVRCRAPRAGRSP